MQERLMFGGGRGAGHRQQKTTTIADTLGATALWNVLFFPSILNTQYAKLSWRPLQLSTLLYPTVAIWLGDHGARQRYSLKTPNIDVFLFNGVAVSSLVEKLPVCGGDLGPTPSWITSGMDGLTSP